MLVDIRLSYRGSRERKVVVNVYRAARGISNSQSTNDVNTNAFFLHLYMSTNYRDYPLFVMAKVVLYLQVSLGKICRVYSRNSLVTGRVTSSFFLRGHGGVV